MELLKFLLASVFAVLSYGIGTLVLRFFKIPLRGDLWIGLAGLLGLGAGGTLLGFLFLIPGLFGMPAIAIVGVIGLGGIFLQWKDRPNGKRAGNAKSHTRELIFATLALILLAIPLVGVLSPSTSLDWDSLAYHLAVPKIWVSQGHAGPVSFVHHSNFPAAVDSWFVVGEIIGGQTAAKAFTLWFTAFGTISIFGLIRQRLSPASSWPCGIAFLSIPMVMWESSTAYIDVANGLFAGFGFVFAAQYVEKQEKSDLFVAAILLALAAGSKYTGLQAIVIASLVVLLLINQSQKASAVKMGALAAAFASPWYIKNWILVGNPVYPFFYSVLGGKNWDKFQGQIYSEEHQTFGYHGAANLGQSIFGLVTSPGRFTNPQPALGNGFAFVSMGFAVIVGAIIGVVRGVTEKFDKALALMILIQLLAWFALSQQSRYILTLAVPMLYFFARALEWKPLGKLVMGALALQVLATLWVYKEGFLTERLPVLIGALTRDEFLGGYKMDDGSQKSGAVDTYSLSKVIDADPTVQKVGLYDEVFGYYLNKPYFWATPGHTTEMGYADMKTADELVASFKRLGITHVYVTNRYIKGTLDLDLWEKASGIDGPITPYSDKDRQSRMGDERTKWRVLLAEAIAAKKLTLHSRFSQLRFLFKVE